MIELDGDFPFLWCLSAESSEGFCAVSMVVPYQEDNDHKNLTIETSILSLSSDSSRSDREEMLEWNEEDIALFLKMVNFRRQCENLPIAETIRVDLTDPAIVDIINVVAAAGFGTAYMASGVLKKKPQNIPSFHCQIGGFAALNTVGGFKSCAVVDVDEDDVVCVLLDDVDLGYQEGFDHLSRHDLLLVNRSDLLHPGFATEQLSDGSHVIH